MCTLTWLRDTNGLRVYFNRDEKRTRLPALPPAEKIVHGVRVLTPTDADAGGSWLAANEFGLVVAVLNFYDAEATLPASNVNHQSRGHLILQLSTHQTPGSALADIDRLPLAMFRPFILVLFGEGRDDAIVRWNGRKIEKQHLLPEACPITTSSFKTRDVLEARRRRFDGLSREMGGISDDMLRAFHMSRDAKGGPYSVTMTRDDAMSVSFSTVNVGKKSVSFYYQPRLSEGTDPDYLLGETVSINRT